MISTKAIQKYVFVLSFQIVLPGCLTACVTRRCLANNLIKKELFSPPQPPECIININLTSIQYETLSVVTKTLRFSSRIKFNMEWKDPDLAWNYSEYNFTEIILPASKIWTPNLKVDNAVSLSTKPVSKDILVSNNGIVKYGMVLYVTTECQLNLFTFPFIKDSCPIAISGWNQSSCGLNFQYGPISPLGEGQGEWKTLSVDLLGENDTYLQFSLSLNPFNALVSLIMPTALIMVVDLVSFALPLDGERNPFKIKLVFSFTMFLLILSKQLPEGGTYSPLIYYHFCFCLLVLVISLQLSMTLSRLARTGSIWPGKTQNMSGSGSSTAQQDNTFPENRIETNGSSASSTEATTETTSMKMISNFVTNIDNQTDEKNKKQKRALFWDKICFWAYLSLDIIYMICVVAFFKTKH